ncbi:MAG: class C beta-lactamase-related serine hydrolase [Acidobacteria bacterium]|nr:MAG: class C beta-lactamase-related serine hydrolase [Acidobacteriota bacterium]
MLRTRVILTVVLAVAVASSITAQIHPTERPVYPALEEAVKAASELPRLHSLLVSLRGELILERYFNGKRAGTLANVKSASKSIISALVGIAVDRGLVTSVKQPISTFFPDLLATSSDAPKRAITIEDLLTMRSGLESTSNRNYGAWVQSRNWVRHVLSRPLFAPPGTLMVYSTGNTHLLSAILTKATGKSTWQFAQEALARPLGFTLPQWPRDPQGIYFGGNDMLMTPRQMLMFGELYLNEGRANGQQILSARWIDDSFVPRGRSRFSERLYGYGWWMREIGGCRVYYAWGFGGQLIVLAPDLDLVVVSTSAATVSDDRRTHRRTVDDIIEHFIIARACPSA